RRARGAAGQPRSVRAARAAGGRRARDEQGARRVRRAIGLHLQLGQRHLAEHAGRERPGHLPHHPSAPSRCEARGGVMTSSPIPRALLEKYATSAPRYTSYPTAVDWSKDFDASRYPSLLERAAKEQGPLSVYVHLPFCAELCLFCGCNVVISRSRSRIDAYLDRLEAEFARVAATGIGKRTVH